MDDRPPSRRFSARWALTGSAGLGAAAGVVVIGLGLLFARPDVLVLGVPLLLSTAWAIASRPSDTPEVGLTEPIREDDQVVSRLEIEPVEGVVEARVRVSAEAFRPVELVLDARRARRLRLAVSTVRTGRRSLFRADYVTSGVEGGFRTAPQHVGPKSALILPKPAPLNQVPLPFQLYGLSGSHVSRRVGLGGDLRDVAVFQSGDRLRRIDWKTTARRGFSAGAGGDIYVRRTHSTADAHIMLVLDPRDNVGPDPSSWSTGTVDPSQPTSLDLARHAAATMARHYLSQGDRVGLVDVGRDHRALLPAGGRRHLQRIVHHLALAEPGSEPRRYARAPQIPSGVLVVLFSTFLDAGYADMAERWRHIGHRVVAVDVLPPLDIGSLSPAALVALRLLWMERDDRLDDLRNAGVEVVHWAVQPQAQLSALAKSRSRR